MDFNRTLTSKDCRKMDLESHIVVKNAWENYGIKLPKLNKFLLTKGLGVNYEQNKKIDLVAMAKRLQ